MEKNYYSITEDNCFIAIEKTSLDATRNLDNIILSKNKLSKYIWNYKQKESSKKGLIIHLDILVSDEPIKFSYNGVLLLKKYKDSIFGFFTNNLVQHYHNIEKEIMPINPKVFKQFPKDLLTGIFSGMYKKGKKPILCLDVEKCFAAYKHFI